jgi:hypothetical protein
MAEKQAKDVEDVVTVVCKSERMDYSVEIYYQKGQGGEKNQNPKAWKDFTKSGDRVWAKGHKCLVQNDWEREKEYVRPNIKHLGNVNSGNMVRFVSQNNSPIPEDEETEHGNHKNILPGVYDKG